ncbi:MAG TPA: 2,3-bisphosphoglycerate-independent phosphoglycerate mutase [Candidatus Bathyarchaeia archaeon]|nr:2,3-bisphosphoglycerate-independent phosphoglycerate mutase [Candidatus Bathyarchaeia archaeon]
MRKPVYLIILDGWGESPNLEGNAIAQAKTPTVDKLTRNYPMTLLQASGISVGLPWGEVGNSEVGHITLGAGRVIYQSLPRITLSIQDGSFFKNESLLAAAENAKKNGGALHIIGLASNGGVHSSLDHLYALLELGKNNGLEKICLHLFTDGRDTPPQSGLKTIQDIEERIKDFPGTRIASVCGRYFAMDRNDNWNRIEKAYALLTEGAGAREKSASSAMEKSYAKNITDEFIEPVAIEDEQGNVFPIAEKDSVIFFNFREDRARQLTKAFTLPTFSKFERKKYLSDIEFVTMTMYEENLPVTVAFGPQEIKNCLGEILSQSNINQLRIAETEKYAHVTYFFNGGREEPFPGEDRALIPSQSVSTYDKLPEMSAYIIEEKIFDEIGTGKYGFTLINFANADMVGHTGKLNPAIAAVEAVDGCLGKIIPEILKIGGHIFITADHGNAEEIVNPRTEEIDTEHSTFPVPFWYLNPENHKPKNESEILRAKGNIGGLLSDVAPTILAVMDIPAPREMTGQNLMEVLI